MLNIKERNSLFFMACANGDLDTVKTLYEEYDSLKSSYFFKFLSLFYPKIDAHWKNDSALVNVISYHRYDIAEYLLSKKSFVESFSDDNQLGMCLSLVMKDGHLELTKLILKHKAHIRSPGNITMGFNHVCSEGHMELLEYLTTDPVLNLIEYDAKKLNGINYPILYQGFISACHKGQVEVVKYLTSSPQLKGQIDFHQFNKPFLIKNAEILQHLIVDLNITREHPIVKNFKINKELQEQMNSFFRMQDIKNLHKQINNELKNENKHNKRIKI